MATILVADDNDATLALFSHLLTKLGHSVAAVGDGRAVVELATRGDFDLLILDLCMPGLDGLAVLRRFAEHPWARPRPAVLVCTAYGEYDDAAEAIAQGAEGYVQKRMLTADTLGGAVERALRARRNQAAA